MLFVVVDLSKSLDLAVEEEVSGDETWQTLYYRGCIQRERDPAAAHKDFTEALRASPRNPQVRQRRAFVFCG